jgi:hypothetical protein
MRLSSVLHVVFLETAVLWTAPGLNHTRWDPSSIDRWREFRSIRRWGALEVTAEAGSERADTLKSNAYTDVHDLAISVAKECRRPFQATRKEVVMGRFTEGPTELPNEVCRRQLGRAGKDWNRQWFEVPTVH